MNRIHLWTTRAVYSLFHTLAADKLLGLTFRTCGYIQEYFCFVPFHTCHSNAETDGARDRSGDGDNTTVMDVNCLKTQRKMMMMGQGRVCVYVVEDVSYYFQEHSGKLALFVQ